MDHNIKDFFNNSFVFKPYLHTGKPLNQTSYIYKELCDNFIKTPKNYDIVSYYHKDGTLHKGYILDNQTIMIINDSKIGDMIFNNVIDWINCLDEFLPVKLSNF